jgi:glycine cleavage system H protein
MLTRYTKDHEYVRVEDGVGTVGVTAHAQGQLGDVVFVELPGVGRDLRQGDAAGVVESVKAASDIYAPVSGRVVAVNDALPANPALVNEDAEGAAWFMKIALADPAELDALMDEAAYKAFIGA